MRAARTATLGAVALAVVACGGPSRGDVQVFWTFAGQNCQQAGVNFIQIDVANEVLTPNRYFCIDPNNASLMRTGADLGPFLFGTYDLTLTGFDVDGRILFQASQSFTVRGDVQVNVDLAAATADLSWDAIKSTGGFAPGTNGAMTCDEAEVDTVQIVVDPNADGSGGTSAGTLACNTNGVEGALISPLASGTHSFLIKAFRDVSGVPTLVYKTTPPVSASFQIGTTTPVDVTAELVGSGIGSATLIWGSGCSGTVTYTLTNPQGVAGSQQTGASCVQSIPLDNVTAGLWLVDATSGTLHAHIVFGVPNQVSPPGPSWSIPFSQ